jgi:type IV secretory pathway VirB2 component (pilin)
VPLPVIAVAIVGMFAAGGDKWYMTRYLKWIYYVGGIVVFSATVWVTDFFGQVFGQ